METVSLTQKKNRFKIPYGGTQLTFSGEFDSGNLNNACLDLEKQEIQLSFGRDKDVKPSNRCWFYFSIDGVYNYLPVKLFFQRVNTMASVSKIYDLYRPVVRVQGGEWQRHEYPVEFQTTIEGDVNFRMTMDLHDSKKVEIALCYPWSFTENENYLNALQKSLKFRKDIYFNKEILINSYQGRPIHVLALSSSEVKQYPPQQYIQNLFPSKSQPHHKLIKKPLVLITSRVHPGEIGASYAVNGLIQFLISGTQEANKILKEFYFLIVPMLNPDGVYNGNNRMDAIGQNLNRFYHLPDLQKQPSCYAIKALVQSTRRQVFAFFDFHGHGNKKSCFLFGNFINNTRLQCQSVLFAKYLSSVCDFIEFKSCNFSKKQMASKDKNQDFSKEGCARVVVHRWTNSPYCYTLQTGLYKNVKVDEKGIQRYGQKFYSPQIYMEVGAKMISSLFAILKKSKQIEQMRKSVTLYVSKLQKINIKKEKQKQRIKKEGTMKDLNKESKPIFEMKKIKSEKQNEYFQEKAIQMDQVFQKNKNYLLSITGQDQYDD